MTRYRISSNEDSGSCNNINSEKINIVDVERGSVIRARAISPLFKAQKSAFLSQHQHQSIQNTSIHNYLSLGHSMNNGSVSNGISHYPFHSGKESIFPFVISVNYKYLFLIPLVLFTLFLLLFAFTSLEEFDRPTHDILYSSDHYVSEKKNIISWEEKNDLKVHYHISLMDNLIYLDHPDDSTATSIYLRGTYSDDTGFQYPICTFTKVCATSNHIFFSINNLTLHTYYEMLFPHCHDTFYWKVELCRCFHSGFRPAVLPFPYKVEVKEYNLAKIAAEFMIRDVWGESSELPNLNRPLEEQIGFGRERPNLTELESTWLQLPKEERLKQRNRLYPSPFSKQYFFPVPYTTPAMDISTSNDQTNSPSITSESFLNSSTYPLSNSNRTSPPFQFLLHPHYWSIHKWVPQHHIAHWSQKLLVMTATYSHWSHACRHVYKRVKHEGELTDEEEFNHRKRGEHKNLNTELKNLNGRHIIEEYFDSNGEVDVQSWHREMEMHQFVRYDDDKEFHIDCLPPLDGILFHDSSLPLSNHEENILNITIESIHEWVTSLGDDVSHHSPHSDQIDQPHQFVSLHPREPPKSSSTHLYFPPAFTQIGQTHSHTIYSQHLFQQYTPDYLTNPLSWYALLPPPLNIYHFHCFTRLTMSPLYGTFMENAYDVNIWRNQAHHKYGVHVHQHEYTDMEIPIIKKTMGKSITQEEFYAEWNKAHASQERSDLLDVTTPSLSPAAMEDAYWKEKQQEKERNERISSTKMKHASTAAINLLPCPPSRAVLVTRPDRAILNTKSMLSLLKERFNLNVDVISIDSSTSSIEQAKLFAESGLIMSAHSSQLVNVMFALSTSAMIEITAEYYNIDFANYATSMGVYFRYAIGGDIPDVHLPLDPLMTSCVESLHQCEGDNFCISDTAYQTCKQYVEFPNKYSAFHANLTAVEIAVRQALEHLLRVCYNRWQDVRLNIWEND